MLAEARREAAAEAVAGGPAGMETDDGPAGQASAAQQASAGPVVTGLPGYLADALRPEPLPLPLPPHKPASPRPAAFAAYAVC